MKRAIVGAAVGAVALTLGAGAVLARTAPIPSAVDIKGAGIGPNLVQTDGLVSSPKAKCVPARKVRVYALYESDPPEPIGTDSTSHNGAFFVTGDPSGEPIGAKARVLRKKIGPRHHRRLCKAAADELLTP
jgi:hypothetical protein